MSSEGLPNGLRRNALSARGEDDTQADFEALFFQYYAGVLRILERLVGQRAQAEDLANEVFWKLSQRSSGWLLTNNVGGWLYRTATRAGIDALRASAHRSRYERDAWRETRGEGPVEPGALTEIVREQNCRTVQAVLSRMKPAQAQLLIMRAEGAAYNELAEAFDIAPSGVGTMLNRAEAEFRKQYLRFTNERKKQ